MPALGFRTQCTSNPIFTFTYANRLHTTFLYKYVWNPQAGDSKQAFSDLARTLYPSAYNERAGKPGDNRLWFAEFLKTVTAGGDTAAPHGFEFVDECAGTFVWWPCTISRLPPPALWRAPSFAVLPEEFTPVGTVTLRLGEVCIEHSTVL